MGQIIDYRDLHKADNVSQLIIFCPTTANTVPQAVSLNHTIALKLLQIKPSRRTMHLERCFFEVISSLPDEPVIKDFDVMFHPDYKVNVLKILIAVNKRKSFRAVWPGQYSDGKLYYSEEFRL